MQEIIIETIELTRRFGSLTAVDNLNLKVPKGSIFGFLGPNGAGKTTTIRMLLGLIKPDNGDVKLFNMLFKENRNESLSRIGAMVEIPSLYPHLTGYENLEVTRRLTGVPRENIGEALAIVKLEKDSGRLVRKYSHGMKQRLGLALALLGKPELLILDEPTNGLDPAGIHDVRDLMKRLSKETGITVFLSSHILREVEQIATHVGIINKGKLLFQGKLDDLQLQKQAQVRIEVDKPEEATKLLVKSNWTIINKGKKEIVIAAKDKSAVSEINNLLIKQGLEVLHAGYEQPSLEDMFLQLTEEEEDE